ncbi:MAG TPA: DNA-processing protein DprA [Bacteroidota bacterium]
MNIRDLLRLSSVPRIGPLKIRALLTAFDTPDGVLRATPRDLIRVPGIDKKLASAIAHHDGDRYADHQIRLVRRIGGNILAYWDDRYPDLLKKIYDPPPLIFVLGDLKPADRLSMGVVGTRQPSRYGVSIAELLSVELSKLGIVIVSGLARGIDTVAHTSALKAGGRTIAVIGSGLDVPYPPENRGLMETITGQGAVISEFPMGASPDPSNFPRRNRLISGLTLGIVVVESDVDGGAMITASTALDQNREVFAIPGMVTEKRSQGPHKLIREGRAKLVHSIEDILDELQPFTRLRTGTPKSEPLPELTLFERRIHDILLPDPVHIDVVSEQSGLSVPDTLVTLLALEFKGLVKQLPGKFFQKAGMY